MGDGHVFKVPLSKKRPSLYCRESLDGLDDIWKGPKKSSMTQANSFSPSSDSVQNEMFKIMRAGDRKNSSENKSSSHSRFAVALLNEFKQPQGTSCQSTSKCLWQNTNKPSVSSSNTSSMPESSNSSDEEDTLISPESLILKDESMANTDSDSGSDIDWDSLTPPAPCSPGDHTVPDMFDLESITTPSDCLMPSYDYLASIQQDMSYRAVAGLSTTATTSRQVPSQQASFDHYYNSHDHIVPGFYF